MAHAHCNPVGIALFYLEVEGLVIHAFLHVGLHECKLVPRGILRLDMVISDELNIGMLERGGELELGARFPYIGLIH